MTLCFPVMQDVNHQLFTESVMDEVLLSMQEEDRDRVSEILRSMDLEDQAKAQVSFRRPSLQGRHSLLDNMAIRN